MTRTVEITVRADLAADDCLSDAVASYLTNHYGLRDWDLAPRWTDESHETITLTVPLWHYEQISDTSGT